MAPSGEVGAAHPAAEVLEDLGEAAHPDAADPDEVHAAHAAEEAGHRGLSSAAGEDAALGEDVLGGVGPREPRRRRSHGLEPRRIREERLEGLAQRLAGVAPRVDHPRGAEALALPGVLELLAAAHVGEGHEQRRAPREGELGEGHGAGAADTRSAAR